MEKNRFPNLFRFIRQTKGPIERELKKILPPRDLRPPVIQRAMRYSVMSGGKRLRPILLVLAYRACGGRGDEVYHLACSVELVHTFSFIHDDLPCMDNDDLRRGKLTSHRVFGEGIAVLAGDALLALAFENLASLKNHLNVSPKTAMRLIGELARTTGTHAMIGGQVEDLEYTGRRVSLRKVRHIHMRKTGALLTASLRMGGILAGASEKRLLALTRYGEKIGLAFQITDDILNVESTPEELGKATGSDSRGKKPTYPLVIGRERSHRAVRQLALEAKKEARNFGEYRCHFEEMTEFIASRRK